ncbi:peptide-N4-(N-acetyl-beta-glucosaminyl)asparagine amidase A [Amaranthus tricolor]|uniref:peptide-N4-(N-acetyl-beta- glucosaminyl)asparagine amidase A n=1 Tax=Amaranthus tricolor TaxID=29722 RepID=UPI00258959AC|nr:peptide-N4-(N-acetyl-beta-glucosaminyl)asparagine amidase A [Amaranthus tricolor]
MKSHNPVVDHNKTTMKSFIFSLLFSSLYLRHFSVAFLRHHPPPSTLSLSAVTDPKPDVFFEVTKPITTTTSTTPCSHTVLLHEFAFTYGHPPVTVPYSPPLKCPFMEYSSIILEFSATCYGRQYDRIFGIWVEGVELLRSCTAEPTHSGIFWNVRKDVTKYSSLLMKSKLNLSVYMGNIVDKTYTGVYHVNVTFHYYPFENSDQKRGNLVDLYGNSADLILPISRNLPLNDGLWFEIQNSTDFQMKDLVIPRNVYRAVLEIYVSFHENDEFWYTNLDNDYLMANNLSLPGNGPFREVLVKLDDDLVGAVWPFTVIFTGGINPLLWRPISAIGSFDLPSYDIEITPFLGKLLDGNPHRFGFCVTNSMNVWFIDANLHLWLDHNVDVLKGQLLMSHTEPLTLSLGSDFKGLNGKFFVGAERSIMSRGWVASSKGNITTVSTQNFNFSNKIVLMKNGNYQTVNQSIHFNTSVSANLPSNTPFYMVESFKKFSVFVYTDEDDLGDDGYTLMSNVSLGFDEDKKVLSSAGVLSWTKLKNQQNGEGFMRVKNHLVSNGLGSTHQVYDYVENEDRFCYFRNVSSYNYTIVFDRVRNKCKQEDGVHVPLLVDHVVLI